MHVPALGQEAGRDVLAGRQVGVAFDRYRVVVEQADQVAELQVSGQGAGLAAQAFYQTAVADGLRHGEKAPVSASTGLLTSIARPRCTLRVAAAYGSRAGLSAVDACAVGASVA